MKKIYKKFSIISVSLIFIYSAVAFGIYIYYYPTISRKYNGADKPPNQLELEYPFYGSYYPKPYPPASLHVINASEINNETLVTILTLQGVLAKNRSTIYITDNGYYNYWLKLIENEGIELIYEQDPWNLISKFSSNISGYILYKKQGDGNLNPNSIYELHIDSSYCVAVSMCGVLNAVAVEEEEENLAKSIGLNLIFDARGKSVNWIFESSNWQYFRHDMSFEVEFHSSRRYFLIDYAVFAGAAVWHASNRQERARILHYFEGDFPAFGFGAVEGGEDQLNTQIVEEGGFFIPSDWCRDLSVFSSIQVNTTQNLPDSNEILSKFETGVHYVTIIVSDGDNLQWLMSDFISEKYYGNPHRGEFAMGWTIPPEMTELCPILMRELYKNRTNNDVFIAGISGHGLTYPSRNPWNKLHAERTKKILTKSDLSYSYIQDFGWFADIFNDLANNEFLNGIIYIDYRDYNKYAGNIMWINEKPCIAVKYNFWESSNTADKAKSIAESINSASRNIKSIEAYSIINVHPWTHDLYDIAQLVSLFKSDVRIVDPHTFFTFLTNNVEYNNIGRIDKYNLWIPFIYIAIGIISFIGIGYLIIYLRNK